MSAELLLLPWTLIPPLPLTLWWCSSLRVVPIDCLCRAQGTCIDRELLTRSLAMAGVSRWLLARTRRRRWRSLLTVLLTLKQPVTFLVATTLASRLWRTGRFMARSTQYSRTPTLRLAPKLFGIILVAKVLLTTISSRDALYEQIAHITPGQKKRANPTPTIDRGIPPRTDGNRWRCRRRWGRRRLVRVVAAKRRHIRSWTIVFRPSSSRTRCRRTRRTKLWRGWRCNGTQCVRGRPIMVFSRRLLTRVVFTRRRRRRQMVFVKNPMRTRGSRMIHRSRRTRVTLFGGTVRLGSLRFTRRVMSPALPRSLVGMTRTRSLLLFNRRCTPRTALRDKEKYCTVDPFQGAPLRGVPPMPP